MKQKDYTLIIVVVVISAIVSVTLSKLVISKPENRQAKVEVVNPISPDFQEPDPKYFNQDSVDPTQLIQIGDGSNNQPFTGGN